MSRIYNIPLYVIPQKEVIGLLFEMPCCSIILLRIFMYWSILESIEIIPYEINTFYRHYNENPIIVFDFHICHNESMLRGFGEFYSYNLESHTNHSAFSCTLHPVIEFIIYHSLLSLYCEWFYTPFGPNKFIYS